VVHARL